MSLGYAAVERPFTSLGIFYDRGQIVDMALIKFARLRIDDGVLCPLPLGVEKQEERMAIKARLETRYGVEFDFSALDEVKPVEDEEPVVPEEPVVESTANDYHDENAEPQKEPAKMETTIANASATKKAAAEAAKASLAAFGG